MELQEPGEGATAQSGLGQTREGLVDHGEEGGFLLQMQQGSMGIL